MKAAELKTRVEKEGGGPGEEGFQGLGKAGGL